MSKRLSEHRLPFVFYFSFPSLKIFLTNGLLYFFFFFLFFFFFFFFRRTHHHLISLQRERDSSTTAAIWAIRNHRRDRAVALSLLWEMPSAPSSSTMPCVESTSLQRHLQDNQTSLLLTTASVCSSSSNRAVLAATTASQRPKRSH